MSTSEEFKVQKEKEINVYILHSLLDVLNTHLYLA